MPKKTVEKQLKSLKKKYSKLKKYAKQLEEKLEEKAKSSKPSNSGKKSTKQVAAKPQTAKGKGKTATKTKPAAAAPSAEKDNLKKIRGIGAVLEKKLNAAGITRFAQIAGWTDKSIAQLPEDLNLGTRPKRDDWVGQAKKLG